MQPTYTTPELDEKNPSIKVVVGMLEDLCGDFNEILASGAEGKKYIRSSGYEFVNKAVPYIVQGMVTKNPKLVKDISRKIDDIADQGNISIDAITELQKKAKTVNQALQPYIAALKPFSEYTRLQLSEKIGLGQFSYNLLSEELAELRKGRERVVQTKEGVCCEFAYLWARLENEKLPGVGNSLKVLRDGMVEEASPSILGTKGSGRVNPVKKAGERWCELLTPKVVEAVSKRAAYKREPIDEKTLCCWRNLAWLVGQKSIYGRREEAYGGVIKNLEDALEERKKEMKRMEDALVTLDSIPLNLEIWQRQF